MAGGKYPLIGNKILVTCSQICYHRGENRWVGWIRLAILPSHPRQVLTQVVIQMADTPDTYQ